MKAIKATGHIDDQRQIALDQPLINSKNSRIEIIGMSALLLDTHTFICRHRTTSSSSTPSSRPLRSYSHCPSD